VLTREVSPFEWARDEGNIAIAYANRILGSRRENLEKALSANLSVLEIVKNSSDPTQTIVAKNNLGMVYRQRISGDHAQNIELGIKAEQEVLAAVSLESDPKNLAQAYAALGNLYIDRVMGSRAENVDLSIKAFESALGVYSRQAQPSLWAQIMNNQALAYAARIHGNEKDNKDKAISLLRNALEVRTRKAFPSDWAQSQLNLGHVYSNYRNAEYSSHVESAIAAYNSALLVYTHDEYPKDWADCQLELGDVYENSYLGEKSKNIETAIEYYRSALLVFTQAEFPNKWAIVQHNLALAYAERHTGEKTENLRTAISLFKDSTSVYSREADPRNFILAMRNTGEIELKLDDWPAAAKALLDARGALLDLFGQNLDGDDERALLDITGPLFTNLAFASLQSGRIDQAMNFLGEGRGMLMSASLRRNKAALPPEKQTRVDSVRADIRYWSKRTTLPGETGAEASQYLQSLRQELASLYGGNPTSQSSDALAQMRMFLPNGGALVAPIATDVGGKLVVVVKQNGNLRSSVVDLPHLTTDRVGFLERGNPYPAPLGGWRGSLLARNQAETEAPRETKLRLWSEWLNAISEIGPQLWDIFLGAADQELSRSGVQPGARVYIVPTGPLGLLPLGLAEDKSSHVRLSDKYEFVEAPSFQALADASERTSEPARPTLAAVINPTSDLPFSELEGAFIVSRFDADAISSPDKSAATPDIVLSSLQGKSYWHFSTHGYFDWSNPSGSGLLLKGGEPLTVAMLLDREGNLTHPRLVVLSACETGIYDTKDAPNNNCYEFA
jgi:tetratricopeptide (TPR) repeat protein